MYLHLGQGVVVGVKTVVGIFDLDKTTVSKHTKDFLYRAEKEGHVVNVSHELPKSFAVCVSDRRSTVYISQISASTLKKRCRGAIDFGEPDA